MGLHGQKPEPAVADRSEGFFSEEPPLVKASKAKADAAAWDMEQDKLVARIRFL